MSRNYNYQAFIPSEVKKGLHKDLLDYLLSHNAKSEDSYYDIHITNDGYCLIVEWCDVNYNLDDDGKFEFVDSDQVVMLEKLFPDNHYELCYNEEDYQERLDEWLKENPGWVKTEYGTWTNEIENKKFQEEIERQMKETSDETGHDWVVNEPEEDEDIK